MVYSHYRFTDFLQVGTPMNIVVGGATINISSFGLPATRLMAENLKQKTTFEVDFLSH